MKFLLLLLSGLTLCIAGYLANMGHDNYGWFLFVAFLIGLWAVNYKDEPKQQ